MEHPEQPDSKISRHNDLIKQMLTVAHDRILRRLHQKCSLHQKRLEDPDGLQGKRILPTRPVQLHMDI
jgi:hypothetical protein